MDAVIEIMDRERLEAFLRRHAALHIYALGDLDDRFWPRTRWFALERAGELREVVLLYRWGQVETEGATLLALTSGAAGEMIRLLREIEARIPPKFYAHLSPGLAPAFADSRAARFHGPHRKLLLTDPQALDGIDTSAVDRLDPADCADLQKLYEESYPDSWFDPWTLESGYYFGIRAREKLISVAGVHVVSASQRVAALGNVTTHPDHRGKGLARQVCAKLCRELRRAMTHIGANVHAKNAAALACYDHLGFRRIADYEEWDFRPA